MATWEDGPEYAPVERPDTFSVPEVAPLDVAPPPHQPAADAPKDRPRFDDPQAPVAPLSTLVPPVSDETRDPQRAFDVVASTLTTTSASSAWGSAHWSGHDDPAAGSAVAPAQPWGPPATDPWSGGPAPAPAPPAYGVGADQWQGYPPPNGMPPSGPPQNAPSQGYPSPNGMPLNGPILNGPTPNGPTQNGPAPVYPPQSFPAPGTPQWFGPGPPQVPVAYNQPVTAKRVAEMVTPGLIICLALGGIIYILAPITLGLAFWLSSRVRVAKDKVKLVFRLALAATVAMALIGALAADPYFSAWWSFVAGWATFFSWTALVLTVVFVYRALKSNPEPVPPVRPPWG